MNNKSNSQELTEATQMFKCAGEAMRKRHVTNATAKQVHRWIEQDRLEKERELLPWWKRPLHFIKNIWKT